MNIFERSSDRFKGIPKQNGLSEKKQNRPTPLTETEANFLNADTNENYRAAQARNAEKIKAIQEDPNLTLPEKLELIEKINYPMGVPGENPKTDEETNQAYREAKARIEAAGKNNKDGEEDGFEKAA